MKVIMSGVYVLKAEGVSKRYHRQPVLEGVNLLLEPGSITTLIGLNGSGKTTLLRILLGLETQDSGTVTLREGLRIGYMPQQVAFSPILPLTVGALLRLSFHGHNEDELHAVCEETGIAHLLDRFTHRLSGGEKQRVLLARALVRMPDLLVLDEPVQGVDMAGQANLYRLITNISRARGCAVLMVSHDIHLVMASTHRVLCLNRHICCSGSPHHVQQDPAFLALFGEEVARHLAVYTHAHNHHHNLHGDIVEDRHAD